MPENERYPLDNGPGRTRPEASAQVAAAHKPKRRGISIQLLSTLLLVTASLSIVFSLIEQRAASSHAHSLYALEQERQKCDMAIQKLMDGSDYLTTQVQQYVVQGTREYMDNYWNEIYLTKSRDEAMETILNSHITSEERAAALAGKNGSDTLMRQEIWAMRMVSESMGIPQEDMPGDVAAYQLSDSEAGLSPQQKQDAAIAYVFGPDYSVAKDTIRASVNAFRNQLSNRYAQQALAILTDNERTTGFMAAGLIVFFVLLIGTIVCFAKLVVSPLIGFSHQLTQRNDIRRMTLKESGALEIRQFASVFNALSEQAEQNTKRLERLGYMDFLTDVPNRASITEYISGLILNGAQPLGIMIVDIDDFKRFNDTYGHSLGDQVLRRVAKAVCSVLPEDEGISGRLCGEEFVVAVRDADEPRLQRIAESILSNVRRICGMDVNLPDIKDFGITVSIGGVIWRGELPADFILLLSKADRALYVSKSTGKDKYTLL